MLYTEKEKNEIERVRKVFAEHLQQSTNFELLWSDKVGFVWLAIGLNPLYVDTGRRIESAADLCHECLDDVAMDVLYMTGNDHAIEEADPLELAEIKRRWNLFMYLFVGNCVILVLRPTPPSFMGREVKPNGVYFYLYPVRRSECSVLLHLQVA